MIAVIYLIICVVADLLAFEVLGVLAWAMIKAILGQKFLKTLASALWTFLLVVACTVAATPPVFLAAISHADFSYDELLLEVEMFSLIFCLWL